VRLATALGALAAVLAVAFPFLPVHQDTLELRWPTAERGTAPVTSPLVAVRPERLAATLPCASIADRGTVLTTAPPDAPGADDVGLVVAAAGGSVTVTSGGTGLADAPLPAGPDCTLSITSTATRTTVVLGGEVLLDEAADRRPEVVGVYSALVDPTGVDVVITVDNRYDSTAGARSRPRPGSGRSSRCSGPWSRCTASTTGADGGSPGCTSARRGPLRCATPW
jgi:arabinosyltransferase C